MIVTAGAVDGQAVKGRDRVDDHVVAVENARLFLVHRAFAQLDVTDEVPRPRDDKAGCHNAVGVVRKQNVAG